ncbi:hypothetical protein CRUP_018682 [Coryphaenoides rupestris]|nr:hypothetical protein CRUP_018682 [Coryphaenoides rupestris]
MSDTAVHQSEVQLPASTAQSSQMFQRFPADLLQSLSEENITSNFHRWSLSLQVLSTNTDGNVDFISTMEESMIQDPGPWSQDPAGLAYHPSSPLGSF